MPDADAWQQCRGILARGSQSFDWASRLLPGEQRDEIAALYAWCRRCDDAIDLAPPDRHATILGDLRMRLEDVYKGVRPADDALACFQIVVERRRIPVEYPRALLDGMRMDVDAVAYETLDDLLLYCWRVAGTVGLMMCHVLGVADPRATRHAAHLGIAMQLTNIARDTAEDWRRGRVYLPRDGLSPRLIRWLDDQREAGLREPFPRELEPDVATATRALLLQAERYYESADRGLDHLAPRAALAIRAARLIYAEIGREIERRGTRAVAQRTIVSKRAKLRLVVRALIASGLSPGARSRGRLLIPDGVLDPGEAVRIR